jgi:hypothetical protein
MSQSYYDRALKALQDAHDVCFEKHDSVLGMSFGPFSGINETLGIVKCLEQEVNILEKKILELSGKKEESSNTSQ